jgi:hypothetical protein
MGDEIQSSLLEASTPLINIVNEKITLLDKNKNRFRLKQNMTYTINACILTLKEPSETT